MKDPTFHPWPGAVVRKAHTNRFTRASLIQALNEELERLDPLGYDPTNGWAQAPDERSWVLGGIAVLTELRDALQEMT